MAEPKPLPADEEMSARQKDFLSLQLRTIVNHASRLLWLVGEARNWGDLKKSEDDTRTLWQATNAYVSRFESRSFLAGRPIPDKLDFERRLVIALEAHGIDAFALEEVQDKLDADRKLEKLRKMTRKPKSAR